METQTEQKRDFTSEKAENKQAGMRISAKEAEEYCVYKRQKKISEIMSAMRRAESVLTENESAVKLLEQALRLRQTAVRITPSELIRRGEIFVKSPIALDCVIGGNGETFSKVKAYEAKCAIRAGARELSLIVAPSILLNNRYNELRKEIKRVKRSARRVPVKVCVERVYPIATLSRLARVCSELGAAYFVVPYFSGCEGLRSDLLNGCQLAVFGVEKLVDFQKMAGAGVGRILTEHAWEIYTEWLAEVEKISLETMTQATEKTGIKQAEKTKEEKKEELLPLPLQDTKMFLPISGERKADTEKIPSANAVQVSLSQNHAKLQGSDLKFI